MNSIIKEEQIKLKMIYLIIIGILFSVFIFIYVYHVFLDSIWEKDHIWEQNFHFYNIILLIIFGLIAIISLYFLIKTRVKQILGILTSKSVEKEKNILNRKLIQFIIGIILLLLSIIIWIPFYQVSIFGIFAGILGIIGFFLLILSRRDIEEKRTFGILIFLIGCFLVVYVPVHEAFQVQNVGLLDSWNIILILEIAQYLT